jgi:exosortase A
MRVASQALVRENSLPAPTRAWPSFAAVTALIAFVFLVHWPTTASMIAIWTRTETFTHGFLVVPASLFFVWMTRGQLADTEFRPWWPALIALAASGLLWLVGELASAVSLSQWAMVLMIPCAALSLFGWGWLKVLAFPLAFLFFAVPFGELFVPTLIDWTADFTVAALTLTGVPVHREGTHFVIPTGRWSVVEACSGIRYLIASVVVGVLYAWTMYRSPLRRSLFIALSVAVPLVANWLRAYLIVMLGHLSDNRVAAGVDHLIYGWVFFGFVIALMFWIGSRWREDAAPVAPGGEPATVASRSAVVARSRVLLFVPMTIATAALVVVWPIARNLLFAAGDNRPIQPVPIAAHAGWTEAPGSVADWRPSLERPERIQVQSFSRDGATVTIFIGLYRDQRQGSELVNSMNRLVSERDTRWEQLARGRIGSQQAGLPVPVHTATLRGAGQQLRIWHWYWIDGQVIASDACAKLKLAYSRLLGRSDTSAWVAVFTSAEADAVADRALAAFVREMGPAVQSALAEAAER